MSAVRIEGLTHRYSGRPPTIAIDELDLDIHDGEFLVLLGPSGCGKTTALRCLAGLESADNGRITFGDRPIFDSAARIDVPPNRREVGMVFQSYALWPHMTVRQNIGYPLRGRHLRRSEVERRVVEAATTVDCAVLLDRYPAQLSGGQQQRVALARGLAGEPKLLLFDEPLSNLDARLRDQVRSQLHELHQRLRFSAVFVTHDQREGLALADRLAVMRAGRIEQLDSPMTVYEKPSSEYVAEFVGMSNRLEIRYDNGEWWFGTVPISFGSDIAVPPEAVSVRLRAAALKLGYVEAPDAARHAFFRARVADSEYSGDHFVVALDVDTQRLHAHVPAGTMDSWLRRPSEDEAVTAWFDIDDAVLFDEQGRRLESSRPIDTIRRHEGAI